ncbi:MAG TPA: glycosyl hydrolase family 28-related protein, partial [Stellaceae bacterium]|nr:glycosyl hydrolase family 28-related protein [Stellaceae bacterium]
MLATWGASAQSPGNFSTLSATGTATLNGDVLMCSGRPWIDVRCNGALGDGSNDDTAAIQTTIDSAILNNWPVHVPAGTYKVTAPLTIDYAGQASSGFRLISEGATLDGRTIGSGPVVQVECSGGTIASPIGCFYFKEEGTLFILGDSAATNLATLTAGHGAGATVLAVSTTAPFYPGGTVNIALQNGGSFASPVSAVDSGAGTITLANGLPSAAELNAWVSRPSYPFALGKIDFSDAHNSVKIDHLIVSNSSAAPGAGGCQFNYVLDSDLWVV